LNDPDEKGSQRDDQQQVNKSTQGVSADQSECPEQEQYKKDSPKHRNLLTL
jgi:hypothetical protein